MLIIPALPPTLSSPGMLRRPPRKPLKPSTAPWLRVALPPRNTVHTFFRCQDLLERQILIRDTPRFTADFAPGGHQAYLSPCCSVIRATPGREVRGGATGETTASPGGWGSPTRHAASQLGHGAYGSGSWVWGAAWSLSLLVVMCPQPGLRFSSSPEMLLQEGARLTPPVPVYLQVSAANFPN